MIKAADTHNLLIEFEFDDRYGKAYINQIILKDYKSKNVPFIFFPELFEDKIFEIYNVNIKNSCQNTVQGLNQSLSMKIIESDNTNEQDIFELFQMLNQARQNVYYEISLGGTIAVPTQCWTSHAVNFKSSINIMTRTNHFYDTNYMHYGGNYMVYELDFDSVDFRTIEIE